MVPSTYILEGGIGKAIAFSAVTDALAQRDGCPIQVYSPYYEVFANNPNVGLSIDSTTIPVTDARIAGAGRVWFAEPYKSDFIKGRQHLIESFCNCLGIAHDSSMTPRLHTERFANDAQRALTSAGVRRNYIVVQFTGGQTPIGFSDSRQYASSDPTRNYHPYLAQHVVSMLNQAYPECSIVNFSLPNEPHYDGSVRVSAPFVVWHEIVRRSLAFVSIDSCLNHMSAAAGVRGVVLWGSTRWSQFGYGHNVNMNAFCEREWDESKFSPADPRNIMIDPQRIVDSVCSICPTRTSTCQSTKCAC